MKKVREEGDRNKTIYRKLYAIFQVISRMI